MTAPGSLRSPLPGAVRLPGAARRWPETALQRRALLVAATSLLISGAAHGQAATEAHVKARMAFNLARFTLWPAQAFADAAAPHLWCAAVRDGALAGALTALGSETVGGRPIRLQLSPPMAPSGCHVLYIDAEMERQSSALLAEAANLPVLTIGDGEAFSQRGIVGLVNVNDTIRFDINLSRMRAAQLNISSQVLKLARRVHE